MQRMDRPIRIDGAAGRHHRLAEHLPAAPGVYLFRDANDAILYGGRVHLGVTGIACKLQHAARVALDGAADAEHVVG